VIDFHCHLDLYPDPRQVIADCRQREMYVLSVTTTPSAWRQTAALAEGAERIRTALGLHPQLAHERKSELPLFDELLTRTRYVGEIGLDGAPEFRKHWPAQLSVFDHVLASCARAGGRVLSLHSRRASRAVLDRLEANRAAGIPILHWFSGSHKDLDRAIGLGCWFSVGPAMLRSERGRSLAARMPSERVLTESDGPFAQIDGKPVMPWEVGETLHTLAELWSLSPGEAQDAIYSNLRTLISLAPSHA
jgi:TatD DNase family protein